MDVLEGQITVQEATGLPLPDVLALVQAKVRLEQQKSKAQRAARELAAMNKGTGGF